jgi:peptide/nickel transport system permease protein
MTTAPAFARGGHRRRSLRWAASLWRVTKKNPVGMAGVAIVFAYVIVALLADIVAPYGSLDQELSATLQAPSASHIMGTDALGRDVFSRLVYGARISLQVGFLSVLLGITAGALWGMVAAYGGGWIDTLSMRVVDVWMTVPTLILALLLVSLLEPSVTNVTLALGIAVVPRATRLVRSSSLSVMQEPYMESAICVGAGTPRILLRYLLPNVTAPIIVFATGILAANILAEATLSFLGLGIPPPHPSWGRMLSGNNLVFFETAPWLGIFPGLFLAGLVLAVNLAGDMMRDVWDPRLRGA